MRVAYLHGFAGVPSAWSAAARIPDALLLALPGHGGESVLPTWEENLAAVAKAIGACDAVIGYSLGARVALGLVAGGFVPRAVLVSVNPGISEHERATRRASDAAWALRLRDHGTAAFLDAWEAQPLFASQARVPAARRDARRAARLAHDPEQLARSLEVMGLAEMPDYRAAAITLDWQQIVLIAGADDAKYLAIARALPSRLEVIAASGHDPTLEQPDAVADAIDRAIYGT